MPRKARTFTPPAAQSDTQDPAPIQSEIKVSTREKSLTQAVETSRCPVCGSTSRSKYEAVKTLAYPGIEPQGQPYTHIAWKRTRCKKCKKPRVDRFLQNRNE